MAAHQAPASLGFSRQEHWSGLPFPSPVLEARSVQSRCCCLAIPWCCPGIRTLSFHCRGHGFRELWSCKLCGIPPTPARAKKGVAGLVSSVAALLCLQMAAFSLCPPVVTPWSVLLCPLLVSHQLYWTRSCPYDLILPLLSLQRSCLQIHSHSELLVASDQTYDFGGSTFSPQQGSTDVFPILNLPIHEQYSHLF